MKIMKVGVLTPERREFYEFEEANPNFDCFHICREHDLLGVTVDFFIRLWGWEKLNPHVLEVVLIQEKIRGLSRKEKHKLRGNHMDWAFIDEVVQPSHPYTRCVTAPINLMELEESTKKLTAAFRSTGISFANFSRQLIIKQDDATE